MGKYTSVIALIFVATMHVIGAVGCAKKSSPDPAPPSPRELVESDLRALKSIDSMNLQKYDESHYNLFTKIFGGTSAESLANFISTRVRDFYTEDDLNRVETIPSKFKYNNWGKVNSMAFFDKTRKGVLGAANIGTGLWLSGVVDDVPVSLVRDGQVFSVESSRVGMMLIGPGYNPSRTVIQRQGILIHEARHSDCTGGITAEDVRVLRNSSSAFETDVRYKNQACGHLHTFCPIGHDLSGELACDKHPWGAYAVQLVYLQAMLPSVHGAERDALDSSYVDARSRLMFRADDLMTFRMGEPDMTSSGYRRQ